MPVIKDINFEYRKTKFSTGLGWIVPSDEIYLSSDSAIDILCSKNIELFENFYRKRYKNKICYSYKEYDRPRKQSFRG